EVHIMHEFANDFYGLEIRVVVLGYIRPEYNYETMDALIEDIEMDKRVALNSLARPLYQDYSQDPFLGKQESE
ncbi:riboflavin kinase, partial [Violaceomyces palustris]